VFDGLRRAFGTAAALRDAGLDFVIAPVPTSDGASIRRVDPRYALALFPFVAGEAGVFGSYESADCRAALKLVAELHSATPAAAATARRSELGIPGRVRLEEALCDLDGPWTAGPLAEPTRHALAVDVVDVEDALLLLDRLVAEVGPASGDWVVTHGEPHSGNVLRTDQGHARVNWDTVALAPRERDLWLVLDGDDDATVYTRATGYEPNPVALDLFRLTWDLSDLAAFTDLLRSPHRESADTRKAFEALTYYLPLRTRWARLL